MGPSWVVTPRDSAVPLAAWGWKLLDTKHRLSVSFEQCFIICLVFSIQKNPVFSFYSDSKK